MYGFNHISSSYRSNFFNTAENRLIHKYLDIKSKDKNDFISKILKTDIMNSSFDNFKPFTKIRILQTVVNKEKSMFEDDLYENAYLYTNLVYFIFNGQSLIDEGYTINEFKTRKLFYPRRNIELLNRIRKEYKIPDKDFIAKLLKEKKNYVSENGINFYIIFMHINSILNYYRIRFISTRSEMKIYAFLLDKYRFDAIDTEMVEVERNNSTAMSSNIPDRIRNSHIAKIDDKCESIKEKITNMIYAINCIRDEIDYIFYLYKIFKKDPNLIEYAKSKFDVIYEDNNDFKNFNIDEDDLSKIKPENNPYLEKDYSFIDYHARNLDMFRRKDK